MSLMFEYLHDTNYTGKRRAANSAAVYDNMDNWNMASADSFNRQYRTTEKDWLAGNDGEYS